MTIGLAITKIKSLHLESEKPSHWSGSVLMWEDDFVDLTTDMNYTHVSWTTSSGTRYFSARKVLVAPAKRCFSKKHNKKFIVFAEKDLE